MRFVSVYATALLLAGQAVAVAKDPYLACQAPNNGDYTEGHSCRFKHSFTNSKGIKIVVEYNKGRCSKVEADSLFAYMAPDKEESLKLPDRERNLGELYCFGTQFVFKD